MKLYSLIAALLAAHLVSGCGHTQVKPSPVTTPTPTVTPMPTPTVTPTPVPSPTVTPNPTPTALVVWGTGASSTLLPGGQDYDYGQKTLKAINDAYASGCILERLLTWPDLISLDSVVLPVLKPTQRKEAYQRYTAGAPYAMDARWYSTFSRTIGYTYNFKEGYDSGQSETRMWTNTRAGLGHKDYAAHVAHELSHQARAGAFVHYTYHEGSYPYEIGDIASDCIYYPNKAQAFTFMKSLGNKPAPSKLKQLEQDGWFH